jgi:hypothetical protein
VKEEKPKEVAKKDAAPAKKKKKWAQLIQIFKIKSNKPMTTSEHWQSIKHWNVFLHQGGIVVWGDIFACADSEDLTFNLTWSLHAKVYLHSMAT